jgi:hypothetical protein
MAVPSYAVTDFPRFAHRNAWRRIGQRWQATRAPPGALQTAARALPHPRTARASPCRCRNKSDKCICLSPHQIALTIGSTATIINPRTTALIVVNHWQFYHTSTLPLATLYNSLNFPESIAINSRDPLCFGRRQKQHAIGYVLGGPQARPRSILQGALMPFFVLWTCGPGHRRWNEPPARLLGRGIVSPVPGEPTRASYPSV